MPAPTKPEQKRDWDAAQAPVRLNYRSLCVSHKPYLNAKAESMMGISIVPLDLRSGYVSDGGPRFIEPASRGDMKAFVQCNEPWEECALEPIGEEHRDHPKNMEGQSWADNAKFYQGRLMLGSLQEFGHTPFVDNDIDWFNPDWEVDCDPWPNLQTKDSKDYRLWWLDSILGSRNPHRPHAHAFLNHVIPLREDRLTTGEVAVATGIISFRRCFQGFNDHRYIHATIFSASFRHLRVIQVWHDREDPTALHVRRSPILDFIQGEKAKREDWITLLCWMMGDQLDPAMSSQTSEITKTQPKEAASPRTDIDQPDSNHSESSHSDTSHSDSAYSDSNESDGSVYDHAEDARCVTQDKTPAGANSPHSWTSVV
ncbi:hypothetical protein B0I37DRAFT_358117 [Chaetomium sp. MPI-CAGE-AT-0009]|nr:hypothetical protein B0I37DRAFT_358117 [Chaetomium sp. MPI-CAGE-AT-0009]